MKLGANTTVKVAAEFNNKKGNHSIVKVAMEIRHQVQQLECRLLTLSNPWVP